MTMILNEDLCFFCGIPYMLLLCPCGLHIIIRGEQYTSLILFNWCFTKQQHDYLKKNLLFHLFGLTWNFEIGLPSYTPAFDMSCCCCSSCYSSYTLLIRVVLETCNLVPWSTWVYQFKHFLGGKNLGLLELVPVINCLT